MTEPVRLVLHKDEALGHARDLVEAEVVEEAGGGDLRVEEEVEIAALEFLLHQVADDAVEEPLTAVAVVDGKAAQRILIHAARCDDVALIIADGAGVVEIAVEPDALSFEQGADFLHGPLVTWIDLGSFIHISYPPDFRVVSCCARG